MITPIRINNFPVEAIKARSLIDNDGGSAVGATSLQIQNTANFAAGDHIFVGALGSAQCEEVILAVNPPDATHLTVPALAFPHNEFEDVIAIKYNKIKIYTAAALSTGEMPPAGNFTLFQTLNITPNSPYTDFVDTNGSSAIWYAWTYFNDTTSAETNFNENERVVLGADANSYCTIDDIRDKAGLKNNQWITDATIAIERARAEEEINNRLFTMYQVPFKSPVPMMVQEITAKLAAGRLLVTDYGTDATGSTKDGDELLKDARVDLNDIDERELVLLDAAGQSLLVTEDAGGISSWPNNTTAVYSSDGSYSNGGYDSSLTPQPGFDYGHIVGMAKRF